MAKRLTEAQLKEKYPHMIEGSLRWNELHRKQEVKVTCQDCGTTFECFTSDLFQVDRCKPCRGVARKAKRRKGSQKGKVVIDVTTLTEEQKAALKAAGLPIPEVTEAKTKEAEAKEAEAKEAEVTEEEAEAEAAAEERIEEVASILDDIPAMG